jgi:hypothetical protein
MPLEILATADYNISRLLYSSLVVSIVNELKESVSDICIYKMIIEIDTCYLGYRRRTCHLYAKDGYVNL